MFPLKAKGIWLILEKAPEILKKKKNQVQLFSFDNKISLRSTEKAFRAKVLLLPGLT